jgi:hypothetical protein
VEDSVGEMMVKVESKRSASQTSACRSPLIGKEQPRVATSAVLAQLLKDLPADHVSFAWLIRRLQKRSFGLVMLLMALVGLMPGVGFLIGVLVAFPASQMILGHDSPTVPRFLASRTIASRHIARWAGRIIPLFKHMELLVRPRWQTPFQLTKRLIGVMVLLLSITLIWPVPFSHVIPSLVIMLISFAYLEEDGVLLSIGLTAAVLSFLVTAATVWATLRAAELIERLWTGA